MDGAHAAAAERAGADRRRRGVRLPRRARPAGAGAAAAARARVAVPARAGAAPAVAALPALQPALRRRLRPPVRCAHRRGAADDSAPSSWRSRCGGARPGAATRRRVRRQPGDGLARPEATQWVFARDADGAILRPPLDHGGTWTRLGVARRQRDRPGRAAVGYGRQVYVFVARHRRRDPQTRACATAAGRGWTSLGGFARRRRPRPSRRGSRARRHRGPRRRQRDLPPGLLPAGWSGSRGLARRQPHESAPGAQLAVGRILNVWVARHRRRRSCRSAGPARRGRRGEPRRRAHRRAGSRRAASRTAVDVYVRGADNATLSAAGTSVGRLDDWFQLDPAAIDSSPAAGGTSPRRRSGSSPAAATAWCVKEWNGELRAVDGLRTGRRPRRRRARAAHAGRCPTARRRSRPACAARRPAAACACSTSRSASRTGAKRRACRRSSSSPRARAARCACDRKAPFVRADQRSTGPPGSTGRVYARVYYRRSAKGKLHRKTVSRRYTVCR